MMLMFFVYLAGIVKNLKMFLVLTSVIGFIITFFWVVIGNCERHNSRFYANKFAKFTIPAFLAILLFSTLIPSERTIYMMGGAYIASEVVSSETADKVKVLINNKLDSYILEQINGSGNK